MRLVVQEAFDGLVAEGPLSHTNLNGLLDRRDGMLGEEPQNADEALRPLAAIAIFQLSPQGGKILSPGLALEGSCMVQAAGLRSRSGR